VHIKTTCVNMDAFLCCFCLSFFAKFDSDGLICSRIWLSNFSSKLSLQNSFLWDQFSVIFDQTFGFVNIFVNSSLLLCRLVVTASLGFISTSYYVVSFCVQVFVVVSKIRNGELAFFNYRGFWILHSSLWCLKGDMRHVLVDLSSTMLLLLSYVLEILCFFSVFDCRLTQVEYILFLCILTIVLYCSNASQNWTAVGASRFFPLFILILLLCLSSSFMMIILLFWSNLFVDFFDYSDNFEFSLIILLWFLKSMFVCFLPKLDFLIIFQVGLCEYFHNF